MHWNPNPKYFLISKSPPVVFGLHFPVRSYLATYLSICLYVSFLHLRIYLSWCRSLLSSVSTALHSSFNLSCCSFSMTNFKLGLVHIQDQVVHALGLGWIDRYIEQQKLFVVVVIVDSIYFIDRRCMYIILMSAVVASC